MSKRNSLSVKFVFFLTCLAVLLNSALINAAKNESAGSQVITEFISAPSLANNLLGDSTEQRIAVYLPPAYDTSNREYPVVYFLPGFGEEIQTFLDGTFQGFKLQEVTDKLANDRKIKEMIIVIANGINLLGGSFYVNSSVTGNWEDFIVKDVVSYVDLHYRTVQNARSRGICGHSMGGSGALNIAMHHPDVFSCAYALSPGLFDQSGLSNMVSFAGQKVISKYLAIESSLAVLPGEEASAKFISILEGLSNDKDWEQFFNLAYGSAFSPNPAKNAPYIDYPYRRINDSLVLDTAVWRAWDKGFGDLAGKIKSYRANLLKLHAITVEYGTKDEYSWIPQGCRYFSEQLDRAGIRHKLVKFEGGHEDKLGQRMAEYMLPFFSKNLVFK